jgi:hypothetical protein
MSILIFWGISCTPKDNINFAEIYIDFDSIETLDLSEEQEVIVEISENSIIKRIDELRIIGNKYFIRSGGNLFLFDSDGTFNVKIGNKGEGPHEFLHFNSFFVKNNNIHIYDSMGKRVLVYDFGGEFIKSISLSDQFTDIIPNYIYPIQDNRFISKNTFGGEHREIPSYSILRSNYIIESNINGRFLKNGISTLNNFFCNDDFLLFWEPLNDTIFSIEDDTTYRQKYFVNFNKKSLPKSIKDRDLYDAIAFTNKTENIAKYASLIRNVSENESYLRFTFIYNKENYYVKYNKLTKTTTTYKLTYKDRTIEPVIYFSNDSIFIPVNIDDNPDLNPSIIIFNE